MSELVGTGPKIGILLLPAFNEASRMAPVGYGLESTIAKDSEALESKFDFSAVVVVDDGSTDRTVELAKDCGAQVISYGHNRGRGFALKTGFLAVTDVLPSLRNVVVGYTDADGSYSKNTVLSLYKAVLDGVDLAVAYRMEDPDQLEDAGKKSSHSGRMRAIGHYGLHLVCEQLAPTGARDPQAGAKVFDAAVARKLWSKVETDGWAADREVLHEAYKLGLTVEEVGAVITTVDDSRVKAVRDAFRMVRDSRNIMKRFERQRSFAAHCDQTMASVHQLAALRNALTPSK